MVQPIRSVALLLSSCGLRLDGFFTLALRRDFLSVLTVVDHVTTSRGRARMCGPQRL